MLPREPSPPLGIGVAVAMLAGVALVQLFPALPPRWLGLAVLCLSLTVVSLDNTILNVALPRLSDDLNASDLGDSVQDLIADAVAAIVERGVARQVPERHDREGERLIDPRAVVRPRGERGDYHYRSGRKHDGHAA